MLNWTVGPQVGRMRCRQTEQKVDRRQWTRINKLHTLFCLSSHITRGRVGLSVQEKK